LAFGFFILTYSTIPIKYSKLDDNSTNPTIKKAFVLTEDKTGELPEKRITFLPLFKAGAL